MGVRARLVAAAIVAAPRKARQIAASVAAGSTEIGDQPADIPSSAVFQRPADTGAMLTSKPSGSGSSWKRRRPPSPIGSRTEHASLLPASAQSTAAPAMAASRANLAQGPVPPSASGPAITAAQSSPTAAF